MRRSLVNDGGIKSLCLKTKSQLNDFYLYYIKTYPQHDYQLGCSISFKSLICHGQEGIFRQKESWRLFTPQGLFELNVHKLPERALAFSK